MKLLRSDSNPYSVFKSWYRAAIRASHFADVSTAAVLATATSQGKPSVRVILYKGLKDGGFTFYTNYKSRKGRELKQNPKAALLFYWPALRKQVRIEGIVKTIPRAESEAYFQSRPRESQLGAWASEQSRPLKSRMVLEKKYRDLERRFKGKVIPCPLHWGGFRLYPTVFEFWSEKSYRLHHRVIYKKSGRWRTSLLNP